MMLEGVVTNVTAFGAFVDIGVHQDGLVHVSELADKFVKDPRDVVKAGDVVKVRVKDVDVERKRIALTMRSGAIEMQSATRDRGPDVRQSNASTSSTKRPEGELALAAALKACSGGWKGMKGAFPGYPREADATDGHRWRQLLALSGTSSWRNQCPLMRLKRTSIQQLPNVSY